MSPSQISPVLERQLLLQLGDRLQRLRKSRGMGTVEMAALAKITRNTLRSVESGDPGPSMGTYLRVMSVLGVSGDFALLAGDTLHPPLSGTAAGRSRRVAPMVQVHVSTDQTSHQIQDLQSLALHEEAVRLVKSDPTLVKKALTTVQRWLDSGDARTANLWLEWVDILKSGSWRKALGSTRRAQQLRQASPLVTLLPGEVRQRILLQVKNLKRGGVIYGSPKQGPDPECGEEAS